MRIEICINIIINICQNRQINNSINELLTFCIFNHKSFQF